MEKVAAQATQPPHLVQSNTPAPDTLSILPNQSLTVSQAHCVQVRCGASPPGSSQSCEAHPTAPSNHSQVWAWEGFWVHHLPLHCAHDRLPPPSPNPTFT